jgi:hypothetical protein
LLFLPLLQVAGETVDEATLTQVLLAVLDHPHEPKAAQTQGVAISEVEAAAHYIVQRFGKSARKVAEQALREVSGSQNRIDQGMGARRKFLSLTGCAMIA